MVSEVRAFGASAPHRIYSSTACIIDNSSVASMHMSSNARTSERPCTQILRYQSCYSFEKMSQASTENAEFNV